MREHAPPPSPSPPLRTRRKGRRRGEAGTGAHSRRELERTCVCVREGSAHVWRWRSVEEQTEYASTEGRTTRVSFNLRLPSARERARGWDRWWRRESRGHEERSEKKDEGEDRRWGRRGWRQGEIEELLSDQRRTEKLFPAFELLHTRAFPSDGKAAPNGNRTNFSPARSVCVVLVLSYARLRIRGFSRGPRSEVNFYLYVF